MRTGFITAGRVLPHVRGHHGLRLLILLLVVAAIAVGVALLLRRTGRRRERRAGRGGASSAPATAAASRTDDGVASPAAVPVCRAGPGTRSVVSARGLTKRYGDTLAVDALSFDVHPGRVTGFLGPNGAGKSTTMRLIIGLDAPSAGSATVNGHRYGELAWPLREVGALLEARAIHPGRTAYAHLWMLAQTNSIPRRRVDEVLDLVGLSAVANRRAGGFSLGMGQRLGIAAALLGDPAVLLFDEPANGLDADGIRWIRQLLRELADQGRTVFVSSHLMTEMAMTADHVVVIGKGRLIADLPIGEFTDRYTRSAVRVRSPQPDRLRHVLELAGADLQADAGGALIVHGMSTDAVGDLAYAESIALHELAPRTASLEEAFIESTEGEMEYRVDKPERPVDGVAEMRS